ncbi:hypothetical protein [Devosia sp. 63-57]|uniref:hypothetical protein n=1 Tax=Devosia sp. 63-57 TaxID=1895751 RepID=UPI00086EB606|nr:hypothetical protein [Devosia sp. 63-57]ODT49623.1 MAG: hypothetical protein ABS74_06985 [Pelagibacterium sp. SCN 63-126]ODU87637.1 MAG: hypothetical protein ABT14_04575 [Pelagibacterium sp. SCN 63-17]OJX45638.1 MAG: hypothetical protein BGO80_07555 [Devosia sp. 63-57]
MKSSAAFAVALATLALFPIPAHAAPKFSFGTDGGEYANDGECDDPRFEGKGMTRTFLLSDDILNDATDCRAAYEAGTIRLRGIDDNGVPDFGDDKGEYANDGECDDMRFTGEGMTATPLLEEDIMHDATDCGTAYAAGKLQLILK